MRASIILLVTLVVGGCGPHKPTQPAGPPASSPDEGDMANEVRLVLSIVNQERVKAGKKGLAADVDLNRRAQAHAERMAAARQLSHELGGTLRQRLAGVRFRAAGENIAGGQATPQRVVGAWLDSPGHRANILGNYDRTGIGYTLGPDRRPYWCQIFVLGGNLTVAQEPEIHVPGPLSRD